MSNQDKKKEPSMAEELETIAAGLNQREEQLDSLEAKLEQAVRDLGLDLDSIELPENKGAILDEVPEGADQDLDAEEKEVLPPSPSAFPSLPNPAVAEPIQEQAQQPIVLRDPAVIELLKQSAGMAQRQEHTRISIENLDRKIDILATELRQWRMEDDSRLAQIEAAKGQLLGMSLVEIKRLLGMAGIFSAIVLIWYLLT